MNAQLPVQNGPDRRGLVLLVDDDPSYRVLVRESLQHAGHAVVEAATLRAARAALACRIPDVLMLDGSLPDGEGRQLLEHLKGATERPGVIFVSAHGEMVAAVKRLRQELGVGFVMSKPTNLVELNLHVGALMEGRVAPGAGGVSSSGSPALSAMLEELRSGFAAELGGRLEDLKSGAIAVSKGEGDANALEALAHRIHGTAGTYGFHEVSRVAAALEQTLHEGRGGSTQLLPSVERMVPVLSDLIRQVAEAEGSQLRMPALTTVEPQARVEGLDEERVERVLLVHPDLALCAEMVRCGASMGVEVVPAGSEAEAMRLAMQTCPDIAVVQWELSPGDDPVRCVRRLRMLPGMEELQVALISTQDSVARRAEAARSGVNLFEASPLQHLSFLAIVRRLALEGRQSLKILLIDDDPAFAAFAQMVLGAHGIEVVVLDEPAACLEALNRESPDLVLLDLMMPGLSGFDVCRLVRADARWCEMPIVVITAQLTPEVRIAAYRAGADDYLAKPVVSEELVVRVKGRALRARQNREARDRDGLTDLLLRRPFLERAQHLLSVSRRAGMSLSVALIDIDHFKAVNDQHGHAVGDQVLTIVGQVLRSGCRQEDPCARWGGEEFALAIPGAGAAEAGKLLNRMLAQLRTLVFMGEDGRPFQVTFSGGIASSGGNDLDLNELMRCADAHLYTAKHAGRNRICA